LDHLLDHLHPPEHIMGAGVRVLDIWV
jgi:hypothetical protein